MNSNNHNKEHQPAFIISPKLKENSFIDIIDNIPDGATIAISGSGGGIQEPDAICQLIEKRFKDTGHPRELTIIHGLGVGDGKNSGLNRFAWEGMVKRVIGGHWTWSPRMQALAKENKIEAYSLPAGVIQLLFRESGAHRPGLITKTGLGTFVDPINGGGKCNDCARASDHELVSKLEINGEIYLHYHNIKIDYAIIRGSFCDEDCNLSSMYEAADMDIFCCALAAVNNDGFVLAQVREINKASQKSARNFALPGMMIHGVLLAKEQQQLHGKLKYDKNISGEISIKGDQQPNEYQLKPIDIQWPIDARMIIAKRACREINTYDSLNFGYGIPDAIPELAELLGLNLQWTSVEQGLINATLLKNNFFGAGLNPRVILKSSDLFDFYSGGGVDTAFLGMGEVDQFGNVNVSQLGDQLIGPGGFIDIAQGAKKVVFCGTFEAKSLSVNEDKNGKVTLLHPGKIAKFVNQVKHITFSGQQAISQKKQVLYITERCVFKLTNAGLELIEVYEDIDIQKDILQRMDFKPELGHRLKKQIA